MVGDHRSAELIKRMSPVAWRHINLSGNYEFQKKFDLIDLESLIFDLDVMTKNSNMVNVVGQRQYDHNAVIVSEDDQVRIIGPILLNNEKYLFSFDIITLENTDEWIFTLNNFELPVEITGESNFENITENSSLIIDERYEKIIQRIFEGYGNGKLSVTQIRNEFLKQNIPTQRGKKLWNLGTFQRMFREGNVYNGHIEYTFKETGDKITLTTPKIISDEVWDKVQDRVRTIKVIKNQIRKNKNKYLLLPVKQSPYNHSILFCGHCGERMGGRTIAKKNEHFYWCLSKQRKWSNPDIKVCNDNRSINIHRTNGLIWETLLNVRNNSHLIKEEFKRQLLDDKFQNDKNRKLSIRAKEGTKRKKHLEI